LKHLRRTVHLNGLVAREGGTDAWRWGLIGPLGTT
jgi:hypothetical protein